MILAIMDAIFSNCVEKPEKFRTSTKFEPVTSRYRFIALLDFMSTVQYMTHFIYHFVH